MSYLTHINRAIDHIEAHLTEPLTIDSIAREAGLSRWYFQRIFRAMVGDTVAEYIQRRRLSWAATRLVETEERIIDIAMACEFASNEVFTRAFRRAFGTSPQAFRKDAQAKRLIPRKPKITPAYLAHLYEGMTMQPDIREIAALTAIGFEGRVIPLLDPETDNMAVIPDLWQELGRRAHELPLDAASERISVIHPADSARAGGRIAYLAGLTVRDAPSSLPDGVVLRTVPQGTYAVFTHKGPVSRLGHTKNYIHGSWLPKSGYVRGNGPQFALYGETFDPASEDAEIFLHIPLEKA